MTKRAIKAVNKLNPTISRMSLAIRRLSWLVGSRASIRVAACVWEYKSDLLYLAGSPALPEYTVLNPPVNPASGMKCEYLMEQSGAGVMEENFG